ncbi:hypothetical protein ACQB6R_00825 [Propionibacteriaceae bacterium G1746]
MTLFLVGGGPTDQLSDVHDVFAASIGARVRGIAGRAPRVAYLSAGLPDEVAQFKDAYLAPLLERLPEVEVTEVYLLPHAAEEPDPTVWPDDFDDMDAIIVAGGHTPSYLAGLAPHRDQLARMVRGDVHYLGYSAGASITSRHALISGWQLNGRPVASQQWSEGLDEATVVDGLAMITPTIATHADVALNDGLVIGVLEADLTRQCVGIDEHTCLVVDPITGRTAHYGRGRLRWFSRESSSVVVTTQHVDA